MRFLARQYYRYQAGRVYLIRDPNACWNGLRGSPTLQFAVPVFADASSWTPSPEQIRKELLRSDPALSEPQIVSIIHSCVACGSCTNGHLPGHHCSGVAARVASLYRPT